MNRKLYFIQGSNPLVLELFTRSCAKYNLDLVIIKEKNFDLSLRNEISEGDFLYRASTTSLAHTVEKLMIKPGVATYYTDYFRAMSRVDNVISASIIHESVGVPIPRTLFGITKETPDLATAIKNMIGGFPLIIKVAGGQKGVGVIKVDSTSSLLSVLDLLDANQSEYILREYIDVGSPVYSNRAIVLGDKVVLSYKNQSSSEDDFRSNIDQNHRVRTQISLTDEVEKQLVLAVSSLHLKMGAVDFVEVAGKIVVFEVNTPFNFGPIYQDFNISFSDLYLEFLLSHV